MQVSPATPDSPEMRIVVFSPAAEAAFRRYHDVMPGFDEAYAALGTTLSIDPGRGWLTAGGYREYLLAAPDRPRVRVVYSFDETLVTIRDLEAFGGSS